MVAKPKPDDKAQSKRFLETARAIGAGDDELGRRRAYGQAGEAGPGAAQQRAKIKSPSRFWLGLPA